MKAEDLTGVKVGDLVKWDHPVPEQVDVGLVTEVGGEYYGMPTVYVHWCRQPKHNGHYATDSMNFVVISSS